MKVCGIELKGSDARLIVLDGCKDQFQLISSRVKKITCADDESQSEIRAFREAIFAFLRENACEKVAIKKRGKKGQYSGGPISFKLEGIIQLYEACPVELISPNRIAAVIKKKTVAIPTEINNYQHDAFKTSFTALP